MHELMLILQQNGVPSQVDEDQQILTQIARVFILSAPVERYTTGQTGYHICTGIFEYIRDTRPGRQRSAVATHFVQTKHGTVYDETEVTANVHKYRPHNKNEAQRSLTGKTDTD
jgi:hypothetical protein